MSNKHSQSVNLPLTLDPHLLRAGNTGLLGEGEVERGRVLDREAMVIDQCAT